jgi:hypothetical protein
VAVILEVTSLERLGGYRVRLDFNNGETRVFDYEPHINEGIFVKLKNPVYFTRAAIEHGTVAWDGNFDFAPEFLYENGVPV